VNMAQEDTIGRIDVALDRYYKIHKREDYFDADGNGLFKKFCDENGFDDGETINEEMEETAEDCQLTGFDEDFPGVDASDAKTRDEQIFEILDKCNKDPDAFKEKKPALKIEAGDFRVSSAELKKSNDKHAAQLNNIWDAGMSKDQVMQHLLAVGDKRGAPLLNMIVDLYIRHTVWKPGTSVEQFAKNNKFCQSIKKTCGVAAYDQVIAAVISFNHRVSPKMQTKQITQIDDSLQKTCEYISAAVEFVHNLANRPESTQLTCPFQIDFCFAFAKSVQSNLDAQFMPPDDDDDESDDDDEDDSDESEEEKGDVHEDLFGDVKGRLRGEKLSHAAFAVGAQEKVNVRTFKQSFDAFKKASHGAEKDYPHKRRLCAFVDRRGQGADGKEEKDELILFDPPAKCAALPGEHVALWYFDAARTCLVPGKGKDGKGKGKEKRITTLSGMNGAMLTLSFHVEASNEIRCYLSLNGQTMRFMAHDLTKTLPTHFNPMFENNREWAIGKEAKRMEEFVDKLLNDQVFAAFYEAYRDPMLYEKDPHSKFILY